MLCFDASYKMADISLIRDVCMDDCDEGVYEQGDSSGSPSEEEVLPPLARVQRYAQSSNTYDRQMVVRVVQELFRTAPVDILTEDIPSIMSIIKSLGEKDEVMVRADLLDQIPLMAQQAVKFSNRAEILNTIASEYLLPLVVRNLGNSESTIDKAAQGSLLQLLNQDLITKSQVEIQVCPAILALSYEEQTVDINTGAISLMSKLAPLLGQDVVERVFLERFTELSTCHMFYVRKVCAAHLGHFCAIVSKQTFNTVLIPLYMTLCQDEIWGVRKACAEVVIFMSLVSTPEQRRVILAPFFAKLLQDPCRWVQMSAYQNLGPFIATFAVPSLCTAAYNNKGELVFQNNLGDEFLINTPALPDIRFCKYLSSKSYNSASPNNDWWGLYEEESKQEEENSLENTSEIDDSIVGFPKNNDLKTLDHKSKIQVEIGNSLQKNLSNENVIDNINCDNLVTELSKNFDTMSIEETNDFDHSVKSKNEIESANQLLIQDIKNGDNNVIIDSTNSTNCLNNENANNQKSDIDTKVNTYNGNTTKNEDDLHLFNSYNYWYISPEIPLDLNISSSVASSKDQFVDTVIGARLEDMYSNINLSDPFDESKNESDSPINKPVLFPGDVDISTEVIEIVPVEQHQDIVPEVLISHFILMTDSRFAINIDNEMSFHCAYSLPAVALTLENKNWPLLKHTIERCASDMHYKVRRTIAFSLHELAMIFGCDIATEHLTPIFEGFIKDLDEVRIGVLKHLAYFLQLITPEKRLTYLPRLQEFLKTENDWNWRFRQELAKQLLHIVKMFRPIDSAKHIGLIAEFLLHDVSAVRKVAIALITELLRHISTKHGLNAHFLVRLVEKFAHSKNWKRRQTFALLCYKLLSTQAIPHEQFATDIMPHLLDLSWDPVANVRLVVAKTIAEHVIPNEYFGGPSNQYFDSLDTVLRRLQADKDRDVRQFADINNVNCQVDLCETPVASEYYMTN